MWTSVHTPVATGSSGVQLDTWLCKPVEQAAQYPLVVAANGIVCTYPMPI
jgi:hypothetical protein